MKNKILKIISKLSLVVSGCLLLASFSPSLDGRALIVDEGVFPQGLFAKTVGYLPGDVITVTGVNGVNTVDLLVIGALDPSEGVAIMLSPEAAEELGMDKNSNNIVKITKRTNQDERVYGSAIIAIQNGEAETEENEDENLYYTPEEELAAAESKSESTLPEVPEGVEGPADELKSNDAVELASAEEAEPEVEETEVAAADQAEPEDTLAVEETDVAVTEEIFDEQIIPAEEFDEVYSPIAEIEEPVEDDIYSSVIPAEEEIAAVTEPAEEAVAETEELIDFDEPVEEEYLAFEEPSEEVVAAIKEVEEPSEEELLEPWEDEFAAYTPEEEAVTEDVPAEYSEDIPEIEENIASEAVDEEIAEYEQPLEEEAVEVAEFDSLEPEAKVGLVESTAETIESTPELIDSSSEIVGLPEESLAYEAVTADELGEVAEAEEIEEVSEDAEVAYNYIEDYLDEESVEFDEITADEETAVAEAVEEDHSETDEDLSEVYFDDEDLSELGEYEIVAEVEQSEIPNDEEFIEEEGVDGELIADDLEDNPFEDYNARYATAEPVETEELEDYDEEFSEFSVDGDEVEFVIDDEEELAEGEAAEEYVEVAIEAPLANEAVSEELAAADEEAETDELGEDEYEAIVLVPAGENPPEATELELSPLANVSAAEPEVSESEEPETDVNVDVEVTVAPVVTANTVPSAGTSGFEKYMVESLESLQNGKYYVQIAVMNENDNIEEVIAKYGKNYPLAIVPLSNGVSKQILVGPLTMDEYGTVLARFKSYGYKDAFLRKIKNGVKTTAISYGDAK